MTDENRDNPTPQESAQSLLERLQGLKKRTTDPAADFVNRYWRLICVLVAMFTFLCTVVSLYLIPYWRISLPFGLSMIGLACVYFFDRISVWRYRLWSFAALVCGGCVMGAMYSMFDARLSPHDLVVVVGAWFVTMYIWTIIMIVIPLTIVFDHIGKVYDHIGTVYEGMIEQLILITKLGISGSILGNGMTGQAELLKRVAKEVFPDESHPELDQPRPKVDDDFVD